MMAEQQMYSLSEVLNALRMRAKPETFASVWLQEWLRQCDVVRLECFGTNNDGQWSSILRWEKNGTHNPALNSQPAHPNAAMQIAFKQAEPLIGDSSQIYGKASAVPMTSIVLPVLLDKQVVGLIVADKLTEPEKSINIPFLELLSSLWGLHRASLDATETLETVRFERDNLRAQIEQTLAAVKPETPQDELARTMITIARSLAQMLLPSITQQDKNNIDAVLAFSKEVSMYEKNELHTTYSESQDNAESDISSVLDESVDIARNDETCVKKRFIIDFKRQDREIVWSEFKRLQQFISSVFSLMIGYGKENSTITVEYTPHGEFLKILIKVDSEREFNEKIGDFYTFTARLNGWECDWSAHENRIQCILSLRRITGSDSSKKNSQSLSDPKKETRLLIVDDDESLRELMVDILESRNYEVVCCPDASSAMEQINKLRYDMIITDLGLPNISGSELAAQIKALNPHLPVMMMTGWNIDTERPDARTTYVDFILPKPFNLNELLEKVENGLHASRTMRHS